MSSAYSMPPCPYHLLPSTLQTEPLPSQHFSPPQVVYSAISLAKFLTDDILNRKNKMPGTNIYLKSGCGSSQAWLPSICDAQKQGHGMARVGHSTGQGEGLRRRGFHWPEHILENISNRKQG